VGFTDKIMEPPAALEVRLSLEDWGELERLYVMPAFQ
jgi:hypothetical protein